MGVKLFTDTSPSPARLMAEALIEFYPKRVNEKTEVHETSGKEEAFTGRMNQLFVHYDLDADGVLSPAECETIEADINESMLIFVDHLAKEQIRCCPTQMTTIYVERLNASMDKQKQKIQERLDEARAPVSADEDGTPGKTSGEKLHEEWSEGGKNPVNKCSQRMASFAEWAVSKLFFGPKGRNASIGGGHLFEWIHEFHNECFPDGA